MVRSTSTREIETVAESVVGVDYAKVLSRPGYVHVVIRIFYEARDREDEITSEVLSRASRMIAAGINLMVEVVFSVKEFKEVIQKTKIVYAVMGISPNVLGVEITALSESSCSMIVVIQQPVDKDTEDNFRTKICMILSRAQSDLGFSSPFDVDIVVTTPETPVVTLGFDAAGGSSWATSSQQIAAAPSSTFWRESEPEPEKVVTRFDMIAAELDGYEPPPKKETKVYSGAKATFMLSGEKVEFAAQISDGFIENAYRDGYDVEFTVQSDGRPGVYRPRDDLFGLNELFVQDLVNVYASGLNLQWPSVYEKLARERNVVLGYADKSRQTGRTTAGILRAIAIYTLREPAPNRIICIADDRRYAASIAGRARYMYAKLGVAAPRMVTIESRIPTATFGSEGTVVFTDHSVNG